MWGEGFLGAYFGDEALPKALGVSGLSMGFGIR